MLCRRFEIQPICSSSIQGLCDIAKPVSYFQDLNEFCVRFHLERRNPSQPPCMKIGKTMKPDSPYSRLVEVREANRKSMVESPDIQGKIGLSAKNGDI